MNSLGRLWALEKLPEETRVLFLPRRRDKPKLYPYLAPVLRLLRVDNQVLLHGPTTRYHQVYTARDLFGERYDGVASPEFRDWFHRKLPPKGPIQKGFKLYITRSKLGPNVGRYCCEDHLEHLLAADGYRIFAPEQRGLFRQARLMQRAEKLIFAEGSALHLFGLVQRPGQIAAVVQRRNPLPELITNQLMSAEAAKIALINAITGTYWQHLRADNLSRATLDFDLLRDRLVDNGLVSADAAWSAPEAEAQYASLRAGLDDDARLLSDKEHREWRRNNRRKKRAAV